MPIDPLTLVLLAMAVATGVLVGWLLARPARPAVPADVALRDAFQSLSAEALRQNNRAFLDLAETRLREARAETAADIDARKRAIEDMLSPVAKALDAVDREIKDAERRRSETGAALLEKIAALEASGQGLRAETQRLVDALKRPGVRGRWGELQLRRVVELAGMVEHCDFTQQETVHGDDGNRLRPDVIVRLPGGKQVVVDAKVPLDAYLKALDATSDDARQQLLADHARQVRAHLTQLSAKGYGAQLDPSPEFVVMFLPGEVFFSAALEQDPSLIEFGVERHVIPASPTTLIALLRAVAYGWQQQAMEENARRISDLGRQLYDAVRVLGGHFDTLGSRLKSSLDAYNQAVGSLEGNVLVKARKFKELAAAGASEDIAPVEVIDRVPRILQAPELTDGLPFENCETEELRN